MTAMESSAIKTLTDEVRGLRGDVRVLHTKLFGDDASENKQGRIPRIEAEQADHDRRLKRQERVGWLGRAVLFWLWLSAPVEFLSHLKELARH